MNQLGSSILFSEFENFSDNSNSPIIDLREEQDFNQSHWLNSSNFPVANIIARQYELPSNNQPLRLLGFSQQIKIAEKKLTEKGYQICSAIEWSNRLEQKLAENHLLSSGNSSFRLWSPAAILEHFQNNLLNKREIGKAIDIGCGAGRDSVYLALQGWQVTAVDYSLSALKKVEQLADNNHVKVNCIELDIEKNLAKFETQFDPFQLIVVSRYLHRPLLPLLKQKIASNGYLVYQTFMQGCEAFGSPKNPRFLLKPGELSSIFNDFDILMDDIYYLADGRPTNRFIAKRIG